MPTAAEAVRRAEPWLRERQMARAGDVLVITGRGREVRGGIAVVREAIRRLFGTLKRKGVIWRRRGAHRGFVRGDAGAGARAVRDRAALALQRRARRRRAIRGNCGRSTRPPALALRSLAERSLEVLGAPRTERLVHDEMVRQFAILASAVAPDETDREGRLRFLIDAARNAFDDD